MRDKRKRNRNEKEETEEIKTFPSTLTCSKDSKPCPTVSQYQLDALEIYNTFATPDQPPCMSEGMFSHVVVHLVLAQIGLNCEDPEQMLQNVV